MKSFHTRVTLNDQPCVVPSREMAGEVRERVNSYFCPLGPRPGRARVLMLRRDFDAAKVAAQPLQELQIETRSDAGETHSVRFPGLLLEKAERVWAGAEDDGDALYRLHLVDRRVLLQRFSDTGRLNVNLRAPVSDTDFLPESAGQTWESLLSAVWNTMLPLLGSYPGLPETVSPHGVPEGFQWLGENAWRELHRLLAVLGCTTAYDPQQDAFRIVAVEDEQPLPSGELLYDGRILSSDSAAVPETIRVYFQTHRRSYGQQRDTELNGNWRIDGQSTFVDVPTENADAQPGTILGMWDDLSHVLDEDNQPENSAELSARAAARAEAWLRKHAGTEPLHRIYAGIVESVRPGSQVKAVLWHARGAAGGTVTELVSYPGLPHENDQAIGSLWPRDEAVSSGAAATLSPPDLARRSHPASPRLLNVVQVDDGSSAAGKDLTPNSDGLYPGFVRRFVAGQIETLEACWIRPVDLEAGGSPNAGNVISLRQMDSYLGRLSGLETSNGQGRPIYLVRAGSLGDNAAGGGDCCYEVTEEPSTVYDDSGTKVQLSSELASDDRFEMDALERAIECNFTGTLKAVYRATADRNSGSSYARTEAKLQKKGLVDSTYSDVTGTKARADHDAGGDGEGTAAMPGKLIHVVVGDRLRLWIERIDGSDDLATVADESNLLLCLCNISELGVRSGALEVWEPDADYGTDGYGVQNNYSISGGALSSDAKVSDRALDITGDAGGFWTVAGLLSDFLDLAVDFSFGFWIKAAATPTYQEIMRIGDAVRVYLDSSGGSPQLNVEVTSEGGSVTVSETFSASTYTHYEVGILPEENRVVLFEDADEANKTVGTIPSGDLESGANEEVTFGATWTPSKGNGCSNCV